MLASLLVQVAHDLDGRAPTAFFQDATGIGRMTIQRGKLYQSIHSLPDEAKEQIGPLLLRLMKRRSLSESDYPQQIAQAPEGIGALMAYALGVLDDHASSATRELCQQLDEADRRLRAPSDTDVASFVAELEPDAPLGPRYCAYLGVSGLRRPDLNLSEAENALFYLALTRRAHMAMAFLAAIDHEMRRKSEDLEGLSAFADTACLGVLLAYPLEAGQRRVRPNDPVARLVDFVGAIGHHSRTGDWPRSRPSLVTMGDQVERSGLVAGDAANFVGDLRSGKRPMTRTNFRQLVGSQINTDRTTQARLTRAAEELEPFLVAAHLFSQLMPKHPDFPGHLDRQGWRDSYLIWWARLAHRYPPRPASSGHQPPQWLLDS